MNELKLENKLTKALGKEFILKTYTQEELSSRIRIRKYKRILGNIIFLSINPITLILILFFLSNIVHKFCYGRELRMSLR